MSKFLINELDPQRWESIHQEKRLLKERHLEEKRKDLHSNRVGGVFKRFMYRQKRYRHIPMKEMPELQETNKSCLRFVDSEGRVHSFSHGKQLCDKLGVSYKTLIKM